MAWGGRPKRDDNAAQSDNMLQAALEYYGVEVQPGRRETSVCCPIHEERTPSMTVNLDEGLWFCFAEGKGGNALNLIMEMESVDFNDARSFAAETGIGTKDAATSNGGLRTGTSRGNGVAGGSGNLSQHRRYVPPWRRR